MSKQKLFFVLIFSFIIAFFFQWTRWKTFDFLDSSVWSNQAKYVETGDPQEFNALAAYGHPGGPIIEGTIVLHKMFKKSYNDSLVMFMTILNSLVITAICILCCLLRKNNLWWIAVLSTLSLSVMYDFSTPPSAIVSPLIVLMSLLTLYFYENKNKIKIQYFLIFSFVIGLAVATRVDIGVFCALVFLLFLRFKNTINWKGFFIIAFGSVISFILFNPFMYFMPIQHTRDLISKIIFHYAEFTPTHMTFLGVVGISSLAFVSIFLAICLFFLRKKIKLILPDSFVIMLVLMTIFLYFVFLTSHYQAQRYFQPIIFIWETLLPLFVFNLTPQISFNFLKKTSQEKRALKIVNIFIIIVLGSYQMSLFYLWILIGRTV
ncbi:MAG: hypothetical protein WCO07_02235 [bacterium]